MSSQPNLTTSDLDTLQKRTFYGKEKKSLAYVIAIMNMILHGIEAPDIVHTNTLAENLADIQDKDRYDVILANPPFGGKERKEVQQNFPDQDRRDGVPLPRALHQDAETRRASRHRDQEHVLVEHGQRIGEPAEAAVESCSLHTVLDFPSGTFTAGVKTVVLFFEKGAPTSHLVLPARSRAEPGQDEPPQ